MELSAITDGMTTQNEGGAEAGAAAGEPGAGAPPQGLPLDKTQVGAAISKLISASIGDLVVVMSKSPAHKHYSLADIEWMVLPPVLAGQFYVAEATVSESGFRAPVAAVTWARVSVEVDARLRENAGKQIRLRPDEWSSGEIYWCIDLVGDIRGLNIALGWLLAGPFKDVACFTAMREADGSATIAELKTLASQAANERPPP